MENNPIGIVILVIVGAFFFYLNKKMANSDNELVRKAQKVSDVYIKFRFAMGMLLVLFVLFIFMAVGNKK